VPDEGRLLARIEETQSNIVVGTGGREHERHLCVRELASHGLQSGVALTICVEHDGRRIAGKACAGKCVYLEYAQEFLRSRSRSFARIGATGYTSVNPGVVFERPETRTID
jgi:hypothetical protein